MTVYGGGALKPPSVIGSALSPTCGSEAPSGRRMSRNVKRSRVKLTSSTVCSVNICGSGSRTTNPMLARGAESTRAISSPSHFLARQPSVNLPSQRNISASSRSASRLTLAAKSAPFGHPHQSRLYLFLLLLLYRLSKQHFACYRISLMRASEGRSWVNYSALASSHGSETSRTRLSRWCQSGPFAPSSTLPPASRRQSPLPHRS